MPEPSLQEKPWFLVLCFLFVSRDGRIFQHLGIHSAENSEKNSPQEETVCQIVIDIKKHYNLMQQ